EVPDDFVTRLTVEVCSEGGDGVEGDERLAAPLRQLAQERVEHLLPRLRVHASSLREDAVEIEQAGPNPARQPESLDGVRHRQNLQKQSPQKRRSPPEGASSFAESVSLSSTVLVDLRLPPTALELGFVLLTFRARRARESRQRPGSAQEVRK